MDAAPRFARPQVTAETRADGSLLLRSAAPLGDHADHLGQERRRWAAATPDAAPAGEPAPDGRRTLSYADEPDAAVIAPAPSRAR